VISEMCRLISTKFYTVVSTRLNFIMTIQNFVEHSPKKF